MGAKKLELETSPEGIGLRIREKRLDMDMTLTELAERAGVTPGYLSKIEHGEVRLHLELLGDIANALEIDLLDLVTDAGADEELQRLIPQFMEAGDAQVLDFLMGQPALKRAMIRVARRFLQEHKAPGKTE